MNTKLALVVASLSVFAGCGSTEMYTPDGYLTPYGNAETESARNAIVAECNEQFTRIESGYWTCIRPVIALATRYGDAFGEIYADGIYSSRNVALGYEARNISEETTKTKLDEIRDEWVYQEQLYGEQYARFAGDRNAREKELARQRMANVLVQGGTALLQRSSSESETIMCRETAPGVVTCSEL